MKSKVLCFILSSVIIGGVLTGCANAEQLSDKTNGSITMDTESEKESGTTSDSDQDPDSHEHSYTEECTKEPTCDESGIMTYTCSCGDSFTEETGVLDHCTDRSEITQEPTCEEEGTETFYCIFCGEAIYTETIAKLPHSENCNHEVAETPTNPEDYTFTQYIKIMFVVGETGMHALPDENSTPYRYLKMGTAVPVVAKCDQANFYRTPWGATISGKNLSEERPAEYATGSEGVWENFVEETDDRGYVYWTGIYRANGYEVHCDHTNKPYVERHIEYAKQGLYTLMYREMDTDIWSGAYELMIDENDEFMSSEYREWIVAYMESKGLKVSVQSEEWLIVYRSPKDENSQRLRVLSVSVGKYE